ncbi:zinc protease [Marivirga tractuosa]|uniref:Peptidase M16 domain protein n=1 Tax=Marivirga tractuosa (strain ATCC 23168 / DSM 4126 / NBRC 15989 / NCIMB 1408 / VKM B-1430 / H-43) TaxID=643867 RepID=E4TQ03_MARTH|nr:M16 family metallopeptidase [Marivirga tractuosa]ADR20560.1 peptidase M16 domain protein [Marivirga tractuosa DSM 4126]BDD14992.1 zinc protease [Marivirga tractuosa]
MLKMKSLVIAFLLFLAVSPVWSQNSELNNALEKPIPLDPKVKVGQLENGLTYYIRQNEKPEDKVEFRLVINAGSMQENDKQLGLAHFTEHMAFNGTENFKKNELVDYLQSAGVKFGADLNAYTSFDETVYILPIPTDEETLDNGLTVLEDWAGGLLMTGDEIDKERGVVLEEWRLGQGAGQRMRDEYFPVLFKDSRYAERLPIGKKEILENFEYETLRSFYEDWYRPNLMAVIAVGDIDPAEMEKEIKARFGDLQNPKKAKKKKLYEVPAHEETYVSIVTDKEANFNQIQLYYKHDNEEMKTLSDMRRDLVYSLYNGMLGQRLDELRQSANPPFLFASTSFSQMVRNKSAYSSFAVVGENGFEKGVQVLAEENKRIKEHGFTASELDRYKKTFLNNAEKRVKELDKTESTRFASAYIQHFLSENPIPGAEFEFEFYQNLINTITLPEINMLASKWVTDENRVVVLTGAEKEGVEMPSEEEILSILEEVENSDLEPYKDEDVAESFMTTAPKAGKVQNRVVHDELGVTELELNNGVRVILKPTQFKNDEVKMRAYSFGGHSQYEMEDYYSASNATSLITEAGVADFSNTEIKKMLSGKTVRVSPYISSLSEGFRAEASPQDLEEMFQLTHLYFTAPRMDEEAFGSYVSKNKMLFGNLMSNPQFYYSDKLSMILSQDNPRGGGFPKAEDLDKIDFQRAYNIYKERFADASDFTFVFVGNFDVEGITPMLETYLGSLPTIERKDNWVDLGIRPPEGIVKEEIIKGTDQKSYATILYHGDTEYDKQKSYYLKSLGELVTNELIDILREEKSGVYGVGASGSMSRLPESRYSFRIAFPCGPENVDELVKTTHEILADIKANGVKEEDLDKVKEAQLKGLKEDLKKNDYWLNRLYSFYYYDDDLSNFIVTEDKIQSLSADDLKMAANEFLNEDQFVEAILLPEEESAE